MSEGRDIQIRELRTTGWFDLLQHDVLLRYHFYGTASPYDLCLPLIFFVMDYVRRGRVPWTDERHQRDGSAYTALLALVFLSVRLFVSNNRFPRWCMDACASVIREHDSVSLDTPCMDVRWEHVVFVSLISLVDGDLPGVWFSALALIGVLYCPELV